MRVVNNKTIEELAKDVGQEFLDNVASDGVKGFLIVRETDGEIDFRMSGLTGQAIIQVLHTITEALASMTGAKEVQETPFPGNGESKTSDA